MKPQKPLMSLLTLVMINVIAIDSLRNISMGATFGFSLLFYYLAFALMFFIPSALVCAELATGWPQTGGVYIWVREAFGIKTAFTVVWIQWIYNICWYPTILSFMAAVLSYIINPQLANNTYYVFFIVFVTYWLITIMTLRGLRISGVVSTTTAIIGVIIPLAFISILGIIWYLNGKPINIDFSIKSFFPHVSKFGDLVLLTGIAYSLVGMEISAVHAQDVKNPQRSYPRALYYSTIIILLSLILSSLAVAIVVPSKEMSLVSALPDAFALFLKAFNLDWLMPIIVILIVVGTFGQIAAWVLGSARGFLIAAGDGCVPKVLQKINSKQMPIVILIIQGIIFSIISLVLLIMPTVSSSFFILSNITTQLSLSCYVIIFAAAIRLRYKYPQVKRTYKIPCGNFGIWAVGIVGIMSSLFIVLIGFIPPTNIDIGNIKFYELFLTIGCIAFYLFPIIIYRIQKRR